MPFSFLVSLCEENETLRVPILHQDLAHPTLHHVPYLYGELALDANSSDSDEPSLARADTPSSDVSDYSLSTGDASSLLCEDISFSEATSQRDEPQSTLQLPHPATPSAPAVESKTSSDESSVSGSESVLSDLSDCSGEPNPEASQALIKKPTGEVARKGRNGYNLEEALDWDSNTFKDLRVRCISIIIHLLTPFIQSLVHKLVVIYLDEKKCFSEQDKDKVVSVIEKVTRTISPFFACANVLLTDSHNVPWFSRLRIYLARRRHDEDALEEYVGYPSEEDAG